MKRMCCLWLNILLLGFGTGCAPDISETEGRFAGYYVSGSRLPLTEEAVAGLTHLHLAFLMPKQDGSLQSTELFELHCRQASQIKEDHKRLKVLISIGGWGNSDGFADITQNEEALENFLNAVRDWLRKFDLDGIDLDWEYPDSTQKEAFWNLILELRDCLDREEVNTGKRYLLSVAAPAFSAFPQERLEGYQEDFSKVDYWNLMTYDYHIGQEGANAPLYAPRSECVARTVETYEKTGITKKALNLGIPLYGRGWDAEKGWIQASYDEILREYKDFTYTYNPIMHTPYLTQRENWISYEDVRSVQAKSRYAREEGLGGLMFWELSDDLKQTLRKTARSVWEETESVEQPKREFYRLMI